MCTIALKWFPDGGFCGVKNRDRSYKPTVHIKQSMRNGIERLYIWDEKTKYTEGVNEFGIAIISAAVMVKKDESEGVDKPKAKDFFSPDGKKIRTALLEKTIEKAVKKVIELQVPGNTLIFTKDRAFLVEGGFKDVEMTDYEYISKEIKKTQTVVRTNHGILVPSLGYQADSEDEDERKARESSERRLKKAREDLKKVKKIEDMLDAISDTSDKNPQFNPLRQSNTHGKHILVTTGQLMVIPSELQLAYRPIWGNIEFDFNKLDNLNKKTNFEVISSRKLLSFKEHFSL